MKPLFLILLACCITACESTPRRPNQRRAAAVEDEQQPQELLNYRLVYAGDPSGGTQSRELPESASEKLGHLWPKFRELSDSEMDDARRFHGPSSYHLEWSDGGSWRFLSLVDGDGQFTKVDGTAEVPWITDAPVSGLLGRQIRSMERERGASAEKVAPPTAPASRDTEVIVIKPGFVKSPFDPQGRPVDVRDLPRGSEVEDPYVKGKTFYVP